MTGVGHVTIGTTITVVTLALAGQQLSPTEVLLAFVIGVVSSLVPDLDAPHSMLKSRVLANGRPAFIRTASIRSSIVEQIFITFAGMVEVVLRLFVYLLLAIPSLFLQHRAVTHYLVTPTVGYVIFASLCWYFEWPQMFSLIFFLSYCSHILADMCTYSGVRVFEPFYSQPLYVLPKKWRFRTLNKTWESGREQWVMSNSEQCIVIGLVAIGITIVLLATRSIIR